MSLPALVFGLLLAACSVYYLAAVIQALSFRPTAGPAFAPPVSVLKPVRGADRDFYECLRSHAAQDYPEFELLFAARDPADPALAEIRRLAAEFPGRRIEAFVTDREFGPNGKANGLERLRAECRHDVLVIDDSDIRVGADYLRRVVAPLADPAVGLVTCLYRGVPAGAPALLEALWISTDFQVSVLVARRLGIPFALGATMVVRRSQIDRAGGFAPLAPYLADDYLLGQRITGLGLKIALSDYVVETVLPASGWGAFWRHRLRWARTLRACRPSGYAGMLITFAFPLSLAALAFDLALWPAAAVCMALRMAAALLVGRKVLHDPVVARYFLLAPIADLVSFAVWVGSFFGRQVEWRGETFRLERDGRLKPIA